MYYDENVEKRKEEFAKKRNNCYCLQMCVDMSVVWLWEHARRQHVQSKLPFSLVCARRSVVRSGMITLQVCTHTWNIARVDVHGEALKNPPWRMKEQICHRALKPCADHATWCWKNINFQRRSDLSSLTQLGRPGALNSKKGWGRNGWENFWLIWIEEKKNIPRNYEKCVNAKE